MLNLHILNTVLHQYNRALQHMRGKVFGVHHPELVFSPSQLTSVVLVLVQSITNSSDLKTFDPRGVCVKYMCVCTDGFNDTHGLVSTQDIL